MKQDVIIRIKSLIESGDGTDKIEVTTRGKRLVKDKVTYLSYRETDQSGFDGNSVLIKAECPKRVTINRLGNAASQLLLETGRRNILSYNTPHGTAAMGITCSSISCKKQSDGTEKLSLCYELDINQELISKNMIFITIKECIN